MKSLFAIAAGTAPVLAADTVWAQNGPMMNGGMWGGGWMGGDDSEESPGPLWAGRRFGKL